MITMDLTTLSGLISEFGSIFSSAWSVITGNWILAALIIVPVGLGVVGAVMALIRSR